MKILLRTVTLALIVLMLPHAASARGRAYYYYGAPYYPPYYYYPPPAVVYAPPPGVVYAVPPPPQMNLGRQVSPGCREYTAPANVGGQVVQTYGTACLQPDGTWRIVE
jgi:surface antigen